MPKIPDKCVACGGTGISSRKRDCIPCNGTGVLDVRSSKTAKVEKKTRDTARSPNPAANARHGSKGRLRK